MSRDLERSEETSYQVIWEKKFLGLNVQQKQKPRDWSVTGVSEEAQGLLEEDSGGD